MKGRHDLRAKGDRELCERLEESALIRRAIEDEEKNHAPPSARRQLLGTSIRLTRAMAPDVHETIDACRDMLGVDTPSETFVYPSASFNAGVIKPERGRLLLMFSSSLLEAFEPAELRFVIGHELGHHLFDHHRIPLGRLLKKGSGLSPHLALQIFAWQRYAEISCDRAGLFCGGELEPAAFALFKLASGLGGHRIKVRIDHFVAQVADLRDEANRLARADSPVQSDWFSTHPFSPLRLKAAQLFADSELMRGEDGTGLDALETQVAELMTLMDPSYLQEPSPAAEAMRRLLFSGGVAVAAAHGDVSPTEAKALTELLGPGRVPTRLDTSRIIGDLPRRISDVKDAVPTLRRVQVMRDLCIIASSDGHIHSAERAIIDDVGAQLLGNERVVCLDVDLDVVVLARELEGQRARLVDREL